MQTEVRKIKFDKVKSNLLGQQRSLKLFCTWLKALASFKASCFLAKKGKAFSDGELLKECFLEISDSHFRISILRMKLKMLLKTYNYQETL